MAKTEHIARVAMKDFIENIGDDEDMLAFAAKNLDADEDDIVEIRVNWPFVTYELVKHDVN